MQSAEEITATYGIHVGDKFGDLTVVKFPVEFLSPSGQRLTGVECVCDCGNSKVTTPYRLVSGDTTSCGCKRTRTTAHVGMRSGMLEIVDLYRMDRKDGNRLMAHVVCDCGNEKDLLASDMVIGKVKSCGCEWRKIPKVGDRVGMLVVDELDVGTDKWGNHLLRCKCDCGGSITMKVSRWNRGKTRHCGCQTVHHMQLDEVKKDMVFGKLKVLETGIIKNNKQYCRCICECGTEKLIPTRQIAYGNTKSCGCIRLQKYRDKWHPVGFKQGKLEVVEQFLRDHVCWYKCKCEGCGNIVEIRAEALDRQQQQSCGRKGCIPCKHGDSHTRLYGIYKGMRDRCRNQNSYYYKWYGARGIKVCDEWEDWLAFKEWALSHGYTDELSIDRIDPNGGYCPENCKWSTVAEQNRNKRTTPHYEYDGKSMTIAEWERDLRLPVSSLRSRIRAGWDFKEAVETPRFRTRGWREREGK